jgi:purine-binding chemotaxis protein CheW
VLPIAHVVETMCPLPIEPVGAMPLFVRGMSVIRGAAVPIVDLGALLGVPEPAATTRFITLRAGARSVALAVEGIAGVRSLGTADLHPLPLFLRGRCAEVAPAVGRLEADLLFVLRAARILPDSVWRALPPADGEAGA